MQAKGEFALVTKNIEGARALSGQPVKRGTMAHEHHMYMLLTEAAAQRRDAEGLRKYTPLLEELAERDEHRLYLAIAGRARGVALRLEGAHAEAEQELERALALFQELGARWQSGRALFELGETAAAQGKTDAAGEHYQGALEAFEALGAKPDAERVNKAIRG